MVIFNFAWREIFIRIHGKGICGQCDQLVRVMSRDFGGHANFLCIFMILKSMVFKYMAILETSLYILCCSLKKNPYHWEM